MIPLCLSIILIITCYIIIAWLGIQIRKHLKNKISKTFPKNLEYHYEINRVLICQVRKENILFFKAITPLIPLIFAAFGAVVQLQIKNLGIIFTMALAWAVVFNPYFAIFMVRIYRRAIVQPRKYFFVNHEVWWRGGVSRLSASGCSQI